MTKNLSILLGKSKKLQNLQPNRELEELVELALATAFGCIPKLISMLGQFTKCLKFKTDHYKL